MPDDKPDRFVDDLLEFSLERYRGEEPRPGLEMRILAGVRSRERATRRRTLGWVMAVCAGLLATIALTLHYAHVSRRQKTLSASLPHMESGAQGAPPETAGPPAARVTRQPSAGAHSTLPQLQARRAATHRTRPEQFPTRLPLTEQEKLLLAYFGKANSPDSAEGTNRKEEASATGLEISRIEIAPLEIKPLNESQTE